MSDYLDKSALLALTTTTLPEDDVQLTGGGKVRVRGLSRGEVFAMHAAKDSGGLKDHAAWERRMVSIGMVAPELTEDEVGAWQRGAPAGGDLEAISDRVLELSGLSERSDKEAMQSFRDGPGEGVRVLPGAEAGDDGGDATPDDVVR